MAAATGVSRAKVHVIWREAGLVPHRWRQLELSNDPAFAEKVEDVVGLYVDRPEHAVVLSIDEKSQIQALDRTQPGLPMKRGRLGTPVGCGVPTAPQGTHDYKRNGTTTLFAALDVLDGKVIDRNMQRHRPQEFIRFLDAIEREVPKGKAIHVILDKSMVRRPRSRSAKQASAASRRQGPCITPQGQILARSPRALELSFHPQHRRLGSMP